MTDLLCDVCGKHIGWVDELDLEGNKFYCDACVPGKTKAAWLGDETSVRRVRETDEERIQNDRVDNLKCQINPPSRGH